MSRDWYQGLLCKLPMFDPAWPADVADAWWGCFVAMRQFALDFDKAEKGGAG